jgi:regulator of RNase E activity RraA
VSAALERLAQLPTAAISDALDALGLPGSVAGIGPLNRDFRIAGPAFTVSYRPKSDDHVAAHVRSRSGTVGDFLDDVPAGAVVVIDNGGRTDATVWGGIMTRTAKAGGVAGTVVHGACRDVGTSLAEQYPIFSAGVFMRTGKDRVQLAAVGDALLIDGVDIRPGDLVCGDADGVVVVPAERAADVAARAEDIDRAEDAIVAAVRAGDTLRHARREFGYHDLQHPTADRA